ncbi:MAG: TolC family protein [Paludisphaera borealis]|uniref:TolC family protein n=1 Tax=Paludisphaera borealis TaxID=1387353 RepID=UPI00284F00D3|nr:TolC family protein [Paludisphaera borealis]MDR3618616.1 TolC family protein [Paludisphaera borealis]
MEKLETTQEAAKSSSARVSASLAVAIALFGAATPRVAWSQSAVIETVEPAMRGGTASPGSSESRLGTPPGTDPMLLGSQPGGDAPLMGRVGTAGSRAPASISRPMEGRTPPPRGIAAPEALPVPRAPLYGSLALPAEGESEGPPDGMTIDQAIDRLIQENLDLRSKSLEIPQARADVLTASLRANPILYADSQLIPYGRWSEQRPGGPVQYDVNISHPVDFSHKRQARTEYASRALRVTEAQYQDAVRIEINNLYTAYLDILSARQTSRYAKASAEGLAKLIRATQMLYEKDRASRADVNQIKAQQQIAAVGMVDAEENLKRAKRALGLMLNIDPEQAEAMEFQGTIEDRSPPPPPVDALVEMACANRPDVVSYRLGLQAAEAGLRLAMANRYQDAYVLYQPYTFQDNSPFGKKSGTAWALGVTVPLPVYNRNQGNIERARINIQQSKIELANIERRVRNEVVQAAREYVVTAQIVEKIRTSILPASEQAKDDRFTLFQTGDEQQTVVSYLEAQRLYNDNVKAYLDTAVRHRRSMLNLNTVVGQRLLP